MYDIYELAKEADANRAFLDGFIEVMWDQQSDCWVEVNTNKELIGNER